MNTTLLLVLLIVILASGHLGCAQGPEESVHPAASPDERARRIHDEAIVIDTHCDTTLRLLDGSWNFMERHERGHMDYPRMREGGLDAAFLAVYMGKQKAEEPGIAVKKAMKQFDCILRLAEANPDRIEIARSAPDIRRIARAGKTALLIGVEGGHIIDNDLDVLRCYHRLGARYMTLTHVFHHDWADSAGFGKDLAPGKGGLTDFGREVVREMNRLGMMVDVSHVSDETFWDVMEVSKAPVIATHSGARAVCPHVRNLSDDMIRALADRGGVVQVVFFNGFLDPEYPRKAGARDEKKKRREEEIRGLYHDDPERMKTALKGLNEEIPMAATPLSLLIDHMDHIIGLVGPDHVGLGSDWDGCWATPEGLEDCSRLPVITGALLERGHNEGDVKKILGGNVLRVMEAVERVAEGREKERNAEKGER
jgi:membrane dipeptidase